MDLVVKDLCFFLSGHAHLTDFNIATIIKDGERATALAGTKPYMGNITIFNTMLSCLIASCIYTSILNKNGYEVIVFFTNVTF